MSSDKSDPPSKPSTHSKSTVFTSTPKQPVQNPEDELTEKQRDHSRIITLWQEKNKKSRQHRTQQSTGTIRFKTHFRNTILDVFREKGWKETESETGKRTQYKQTSFVLIALYLTVQMNVYH